MDSDVPSEDTHFSSHVEPIWNDQASPNEPFHQTPLTQDCSETTPVGKGTAKPPGVVFLDDLRTAAMRGNITVVKDLISKEGGHNNYTNLWHEQVTFCSFWSLVRRDPEILRFYLSSRPGKVQILFSMGCPQPQTFLSTLLTGISVDTVFSSGWTPLMYAASNGNAALVEELLELGADPNLHRSLLILPALVPHMP